MKFQKLLMTGCRDMDKKHQKYPQNGFFPPFVTTKDFFLNQALSILYLMVPLLHAKNYKKPRRGLRDIYRPTDTDTRTDKGDY